MKKHEVYELRWYFKNISGITYSKKRTLKALKLIKDKKTRKKIIDDFTKVQDLISEADNFLQEIADTLENYILTGDDEKEIWS